MAHFDPTKDNFITTDTFNTGLRAILWQKEGEVFRLVAFASRFLTNCETKYVINELELLGSSWGLEHFRYFVYGKNVNLLTDHQPLQPLLERSRAHQQYSARLTRWLDRLSHIDVNVQYTTGENFPVTDQPSRHPITHGDATETQRENERDDTEFIDGYVLNQIYGLFNFNRTNGSITQYIGHPPPTQKVNQSQSGAHTHANATKTTIQLKRKL